MGVRKILLIEGCVNLLIMLLKLAVGLMSNSAAIIADALHSLTDVANNVVAWMAVKMAEEPADSDHPYGHQKYEQLAVFIIAFLLSVVAFEVMVSAFRRFGQPVKQSTVGLTIMFITLLVNISLSLWERGWAKRLDSDILHADASHTFSDVLTTLVVIVGWQLAAQGYYWLDTIFAVMVALIILYLAFKLFQRAIPILVDHSELDPKDVSQAVSDIVEVRGVRRVRSRTSSKGHSADVVVMVDPKLSTTDSHLIADDIEKVLADKFDIQDVVVHIEPTKNDVDKPSTL
jgi:cation diffusion facilitator family transporter